ncbi:MAG: hypothetical protein U0441_38470 [Polyangiaceae bacterium]
MRWTRPVLPLVAALVMGCHPAETGGKGSGPIAVTAVDGAPPSGTTPEKTTLPLESEAVPTRLSLYHGTAAIGTTLGLYVGSLSATSLKEIPVVPGDGEPTSTGSIAELVPRGGGGLFAVTENGLFHDGQGVLLFSPMNGMAELKDNPITWLDAQTFGEDEEIWIATKKGALHVLRGKIDSLSLKDEAGAAETIVSILAVGYRKAVFVTAKSTYEVDVGAGTAAELEEGMGTVRGFSRAEDGALYVATDTGLFVREPQKGVYSRYTLSPAGGAPTPVLAVAAAFGTVAFTTKTGLLQLEADKPVHIADLEGDPAGVAVDAQGDIWAAEGGAVIRHVTGAPVSFEKDVKPFFGEHCMSCHESGTSGAPKVDFLSYDVAKEKAPTVVKRLQGDGSVMPPSNIEVLTSADYSVVTRWVSGGLLP